jgi:hypothetical protein
MSQGSGELAKALPVKTVPLAEFAFHFDSTCYFGPAGITVRQLADMIGLVLRADLSYPIILAAEGWIMDGRSDGYLAAGGPAYPRTVDTVGRPALP